MVLLGETHLRNTVREYAEHYHVERNHQGLGNALIELQTPGQPRAGPVIRRRRLGGLLNHYHREAA